MKKILILLGLTILMGACSSPNESESILQTLNDYGTITIRFGDTFDDYHSLDNKCYNNSGVEKECGRILGDISDEKYYIRIYDKTDKEKSLYLEMNEDGLAAIGYFDKDGSYTNQIAKQSEHSYLFDRSYCSYYFKGEPETSYTKCDPKFENEYNALKTHYNETLKNLGLDESNLTEFATWFQNNDGKELKESVASKQALQKSLSSTEVKNLLSKKFTFIQADSGIIMDDNINFHNLIYLNDSEVLVYKCSSYENLSLYVFPSGNYSASSKSSTCTYSLSDKAILKNSSCTKEEIKEAEIVQFNFKSILEENRITLEELFSLFQNYK